MLLDAMIGGENLSVEDCGVSSQDILIVSWLSYIYLFLANVIMLNLLIAILSKTFDVVSDNSAANYQLLFAQLTVGWQDAEIAPPPFNLLAIPHMLFTQVARSSSEAACMCSSV